MKNRKALTLIEVIITIAIISIMAVTILGIFSTGIINISKSGKRTTNILDVQARIDERIKEYEENGEIKEENKDKDTKENIQVKFTLSDIEITKDIEGTLIEESDSKDPSIKITTFVINEVENEN